MESDKGDFGGAVDADGSSTTDALVHIEGLGGVIPILSGVVVPAGGFAEHKVGEGMPDEDDGEREFTPH